MQNKRIIACLVIKDGIVVQSINFRRYLPVGEITICVEFLNKWGIDEIVLLDIDATREKRAPHFNRIKNASKKSFVPLTVGGGIQNLEDIRKLIHYGADKVCINKKALVDTNFITEAARVFGSQCIVVSMDVKLNKNGKYEMFSDSGQIPTSIALVEWSQRVEQLGAGEIFLNSIDRDGSKQGYDIDLIRMVSGSVRIPVIACGGAGHPRHFTEGIVEGKASAVAAGNYFHFTEHSPIVTKAYLRRFGIDVRLDTYANYKDVDFQESGRIAKRSEKYLDKLRFEYQHDEVI